MYDDGVTNLVQSIGGTVAVKMIPKSQLERFHHHLEGQKHYLLPVTRPTVLIRVRVRELRLLQLQKFNGPRLPLRSNWSFRGSVGTRPLHLDQDLVEFGTQGILHLSPENICRLLDRIDEVWGGILGSGL